MNDAPSFKAITVWQRVSSGSAVCYECVESPDTGLFTVLVATAVQLPADRAPLQTPTSSFVNRFVELDDESAEPDERTEWFATLSEAIQAHRREFDEEFFASAIPGYRTRFGYD